MESQLGRLQKEFWSHLQRQQSKLPSLINETADFKANARANVYGTAYLVRLQKAIGVDFPILSRILGEDNLDSILEQYVLAHPSTSYTIRDASALLPKFLDTHTSTLDLPTWASELAALEWALVDLFDYPDELKLTLSELSQIEPANWLGLTFKWASDVRWLHSSYCFKDMLSIEDVHNPTFQQSTYRVWRNDEEVYWAALSGHEQQLYQLINEGRAFGEISTFFGDQLGLTEGSNVLFKNLSQWVSEGMFSAL
ncbi:MAG: putative DNA-binding domain-containing protein [Oligoflexia bacterium]|nr:putative DNA-binding domain-containing protein [Oligoflexia bacterium]